MSRNLLRAFALAGLLLPTTLMAAEPDDDEEDVAEVEAAPEAPKTAPEKTRSGERPFKRPAFLGHGELSAGLGLGAGISLNFEYAPINQFILRIGYAFSGGEVEMENVESGEKVASISGSTNGMVAAIGGLFGGKHSFEITGGVTIFEASAEISAYEFFGAGDEGTFTAPVMFLGYRYQGEGGGMFRVGLGYTSGIAGGLVIGGGFGGG